MPVANTVYKLWLGLCPFGKSLDFPKLVYIWRGSCQNTPQLIYNNVVLHVKKHRNDTKLVRKEKKKAMNG
jgi:hypothetical protein